MTKNYPREPTKITCVMNETLYNVYTNIISCLLSCFISKREREINSSHPKKVSGPKERRK